MRIIAALPLILVLGACQVSKDDANDSVTVTYNEDVAANTAADVGNFAENVGQTIANDVERTADKVQNTDVDVDVNEVPVQAGDYVVLCSDGLTRMVPEHVVCGAIVRLRDPQRICDYLIGVANTNGGLDNITVVVVEVTGSPWARLVNRWRRSAGRGHDAETHVAV